MTELGLSSLALNTSYHKGDDDIAASFYLPCMHEATGYERAVGFFSSGIIALAWPELIAFVERGGRMRIVCSPVLSAEDIEALRSGYGMDVESRVDSQIAEEIHALAADNVMRKPTQILASLVRMGSVELRVAFMLGDPSGLHTRLFHDKLGIFTDAYGNAVAFRGSMNETWCGLSFDGHMESVDVYLGWDGGRDEQRVLEEREFFNRLWNDDYPGLVVKPFPAISSAELDKYARLGDWTKLVDEIVAEVAIERPTTPDGRFPRHHQLLALEAWEANGRRGIVKHATGSGKTYTALLAARGALERDEVVLVIVPSRELLKQWYREASAALVDMRPAILRCGDKYTQWRSSRLLRPWTTPSSRNTVVISTIQTASTEQFRSSLNAGPHLTMIVDEVHRAGSEENSRVFEIPSGARLGLSATPERYGDPDGTRRIMDYFERILPAPFTLHDGIVTHALVPYFYYPHTTPLDEEEQGRWDQLTYRIRQIVARQHQLTSADDRLDDQLRSLRIARAKVLKKAESKVDLASGLLSEKYSPGDKWLVYCEDRQQMNRVLAALWERDLPAHEYHSQMAGDRDQTMRHFTEFGEVLVAIRCLDEGVDIPDVDHALILASSRNPREFIQRRGRVLRPTEMKRLAFVHDCIVVPAVQPDGDPEPAVVVGELTRAIGFARDAENKSAALALEMIASSYGVDWNDFADEGWEDES